MARGSVSSARRSPTHLPSAVSAEAKSTLVEALFRERDPIACAQIVLRWLGRQAAVERSMCALVDEERGCLVGLAGDGIAHARIEQFAVDLTDRENPLVVALGSQEPLHFSGSEAIGIRHPITPLDDQPFLGVPLVRPERDDGALGMLLLAGIDSTPRAEIRWAAEMLAARLLCDGYRRVRANERRLRREQLMLSAIVDAVTDPILLSDSEGRMLVANTHAEQLLSTGETDSEGRRRAVALNNMLFSAALFKSSDNDSGPSRRELLLVDPTVGRDLLFEHLTSPIGDERNMVGVVSILRNVNDLRRATEEIEEQYRRLKVTEANARAERDRLDLIINAVADPVLVTDAQGNIELLNPPAERLLTVPSAGGDGASERHIRANDAVLSSFVSHLYTSQSLRWRGQITLVEPSTAANLAFEAIAGKVISKQGEVTAVVTILHDRSEAIEKALLYEQVKRHSEELRAKIAEATAELTQQNELLRRQAIALEQASTAKSQFLANISHELRTPLNAILGYTELLMHGLFGDLADRQREKLVRVDANARHLLTLINDLLDISRIESGRMPVNVESFELPRLFDEVMTEIEPLVQQSRLTVTYDCQETMPRLETDRQKLKQVVMNLLSNAIKFTPEGFVRLGATLDAVDDFVVISVADTGIGIDPADQSRIFEDFHQVDGSNTRRYPGTGLGLGICRRFASLLGGRLTVESAPGAGSTFSLFFPPRRTA